MITRRTFLLASAFGAFSFASASSARAGSYVLVRNASNPTARVTRAEVKHLFTGITKVWGGSVVQPVLGEEGSGELAWLAAQIFEATPREVLTRIKQEIFRGEMKRPIIAKSAAECLAAVGKYRGGIGVLDAESAKGLPANVAILVSRD
jgi:hypothetical protein